MRNATAAMAMMHRSCETDVHVSIDDSGSGYSSLARRTSLPVQEIKNDKRCIALPNDAGNVG